MNLNDRARSIADELISREADTGIGLHTTDSGTRIVDCGVAAAGGDEAGIGMARVAMAGLGRVRLDAAGVAFERIESAARWPFRTVVVESDSPVEACLASQYAGWKVSEGKFFAMASGPVRASIGREELFDVLFRAMGRDLRERASTAVGLLEAAKLPPDDVCRTLAREAGVTPDRLVLLVARTASPAGTLQVIARSLETALHKLETLHFDLGRVRRGFGRAPLSPVAGDDLAAIGRTNDAILYGGEVVLEVGGDDASLAEIGPRVVSSASPAFGEPFASLFAKAGGDFYAIDPALFAPAMIEFRNVDSGVRHRFGAVAPDIVAASFHDTRPAGRGVSADGKPSP
jgi:methenyltetrahydromethanopterin cyclohydrolase